MIKAFYFIYYTGIYYWLTFWYKVWNSKPFFIYLIEVNRRDRYL